MWHDDVGSGLGYVSISRTVRGWLRGGFLPDGLTPAGGRLERLAKEKVQWHMYSGRVPGSGWFGSWS